ncbi:Adaptive-response sensory-kinase SasA [compost metagenome]|jgi:two-component system nitrogen regulation sensor histidine kinase NtrY|uniref:histidine kinase n=2 Tax=Sphingomonadaceae TaxID=41297 RepID=A0ABU4PLB0_9SPHN|nr:ATP-binding protein [Sphingomonas echinoides]MDX5984886.1 ATP-binding protein [Sphingomonas echinoides]
MSESLLSVPGSGGMPPRFRIARFLELAVLAVALIVAGVSYWFIARDKVDALLSPALVASLLLANLLPWIALLVLLGRRIAMRRAALLPIGGRGRLHVQLVALFSIIAAVPTLLVVIFASLLFQYGVQFWYSDQARSMIENATGVAKTSYQQMLQRWQEATVTAASDIGENFSDKIRSPSFPEYFGKYQIFYRSFSDGFLFIASPDGKFHEIINLNPDKLELAREVSPADLSDVQTKVPSITTVKGDRIKTLAPIPGTTNVYLLTVARSDVRVMEVQSQRSAAVLSSYRDFLARSRSLQLKFNAALLGISLLIIAIAVWIALEVADRIVRPLGDLVAAADRVSTGDFTARVPAPKTDDEIGTLTSAFNQMTERLQAQTGALESRRALIEAVMSGVTAGVISVAPDGTIRLINRSAITLLDGADDMPVGKPLKLIAPELAALLDGQDREAIIETGTGNDARTLAVKVTRAVEGPILTFDDITGQLLDQRRAAWSDVARRIAHEIKNPLTPIQLAAERLQRRYGKQIDPEDTTFARLTDTIVRQVGDLRRMVDEFSSFARMPKPVFREESLVDLARQTLFLHEVAHPGVVFSLTHEAPGPMLVCDRRQIGQALTNIVKNAVEAVEANPGAAEASVTMSLDETPERTTITVADTGIGLPAARDRIVEPYVTTRARGTGLGLAIVKKIVEEHFGTMTFADRPGGGTIVTVSFDTAMLANLDAGDGGDGGIAETPPQQLLQNRT